MKATPNDLKQLGDKIAQDFLDRGAPLQDSLEKVAESHSLNAHQLYRVAEQANLKSHLAMLKTASPEDAYITFDVADAAKVKPFSKQAEASMDYHLPPETNLFKVAQDTTAVETEVKKIPDSEQYLISTEKIAKVRKAHNDLLQNEWRVQDKIESIYHVVKQAALSGTPEEALGYTIKTASVWAKPILDALEPNLTKDKINLSASDSNLSKYASKRLNPDNKLVKLCEEFDKLAFDISNEFLSFVEKAKGLDTEKPLEKKAFDGSFSYIGKQLKNLITFPAKYPKTALATGALGVGYVGGKKRKDKEKEFEAVAKRYQTIRK